MALTVQTAAAVYSTGCPVTTAAPMSCDAGDIKAGSPTGCTQQGNLQPGGTGPGDGDWTGEFCPPVTVQCAAGAVTQASSTAEVQPVDSLLVPVPEVGTTAAADADYTAGAAETAVAVQPVQAAAADVAGAAVAVQADEPTAAAASELSAPAPGGGGAPPRRMLLS